MIEKVKPSSSSFALKKVFEGTPISTISPPSIEKIEEVSITQHINQEVDQQTLNTVWTKLIESIQPAQLRLRNALEYQFPKISQDTQGGITLNLMVINALQEQEINRNKGDLINFLCRELKNNSLSLEIKVAEIETVERVILLPEDVIAKFSIENPAFDKLKKVLALDYK